jgi:hypothetical protein
MPSYRLSLSEAAVVSRAFGDLHMHGAFLLTTDRSLHPIHSCTELAPSPEAPTRYGYQIQLYCEPDDKSLVHFWMERSNSRDLAGHPVIFLTTFPTYRYLVVATIATSVPRIAGIIETIYNSFDMLLKVIEGQLWEAELDGAGWNDLLGEHANWLRGVPGIVNVEGTGADETYIRDAYAAIWDGKEERPS